MVNQPQMWSNYHKNISITVGEIAAIGRPGPHMLASSAKVIKKLLRKLSSRHKQVGLIGSGWSLSSLLGSTDCMTKTDNLDGLAMATRKDLAPQSTLDPGRCVFAGGGVKCQQLSYFGELRGLSLPTSGSYLEPSLAGVIATGVIGSRLGEGGVQNMVRGMLVVISDRRSVWVEPKSKPALSNRAARQIADEVIRDDTVFNGALVHLGGMGVMAGYLVELVPADTYRIMRLRRKVDPAWVAALQTGRFCEVAAFLGEDADPAYYEVQIDPFDPFGSEALHTLYFRNEGQDYLASERPSLMRSLDGIAAMVPALSDFALAGKEQGLPPLPDDVFATYSSEFFKPTKDNRPTGNLTWGEIHAGQASRELQGLIYTSAFAVDRESLGRVIEASRAAYQDLLSQGTARHMLFTLRFVTGTAGALAFTRFSESVVVDMEGLSISPSSEKLGHAATSALISAEIPYAAHWGKLQEPNAQEVEAWYGPSSDPNSPVSLWRQARRHLLDDSDFAELLSNNGLINWGLI